MSRRSREGTRPLMTGSFDYRLFGLRVRSELALPELAAVEPCGKPDATIRSGRIAVPPASKARLTTTEAGLLLAVEGVARYLIANGSEITVDAQSGVPAANIRLYLLGSAMGVLLHQRGLLPLHANCVEIRGKAVAFMGKSGAGKSTLAAWFHDRGHRVIADDVCVVRFDEFGRPFVSPGLPRLRLWKEALEATGREPSRYNRSYAGDETYEKFDVSIGGSEDGAAEIELAAIYTLETGPELAITRLNGVEAAEAVFANTYRGGYLAAAGNQRLHWESCVELIRRTPIYQFSRTWGLPRLGTDAEQIVAHAEKLMASGPQD